MAELWQVLFLGMWTDHYPKLFLFLKLKGFNCSSPNLLTRASVAVSKVDSY